MNCSESVTESASPLRLAGTLDTYAAAGLRDELARGLRELPSLAVDLSDVESCDFTIVQLLCSARRTAERAGRTFTVLSLSEGVLRACAALGVSPEAFSAVRND